MTVNSMLTTDAHLDLALDVEKQRAYGRRRVIVEDYLKTFQKGNIGIVVSSIFVQNIYIPEMALRVALRQVAAIRADILESQDCLALCTTYTQIECAHKEGQIAILLSFEDCIPLGVDSFLLPVFYDLGVRFMGLSWSRRNAACDGALLRSTELGTSGGLTSFGVELVKECDRLGMFLDVSHLNEKGFWDVCKNTSHELIASHSNARGLMDTERNLTDQQILEISSRNGFIGVNAMSFLLSEQEEQADIETLCDHIEYIAEVGGIHCVGFGFDFNDQILRYIPEQEQELVSVPCRDVINGYGQIPKLLERLKRRGFSSQDIESVQGGNFMRVLKGSF